MLFQLLSTLSAAALAGVVVLLATSVPAPAEEGPFPVWWAPELRLESLDKIDERLNGSYWSDGDGLTLYRPKPDSDEHERVEARSCLDFRRFTDKGYWGSSENNRNIVLGILANCRAIALLKSAKPAQRSYLREVFSDGSIVGYLPALIKVTWSCDYICRQVMAHERGISWKVFDPTTTIEVSDRNEAHLDSYASSGVLRVRARADINGDDVEDVVIVSTVQGKWGRFIPSDVYVLTRHAPDGLITVFDPDSYLCPEYVCEAEYDYPAALKR